MTKDNNLYEIQVYHHDKEDEGTYYCLANNSDIAIALVDKHIRKNDRDACIINWEIKLPFLHQELNCNALDPI